MWQTTPLTHTDISTASEARARVEIVAADRVIRAVTGEQWGISGCPTRGTTPLRRSNPSMESCARSGSGTSSRRMTSTQMTGRMHRVRSRALFPFRLSTAENVTMLLHDGGGAGREMTVDYVRRLIPYAKAHGYTFQTMPQVQPDLAARVTTVATRFLGPRRAVVGPIGLRVAERAAARSVPLRHLRCDPHQCPVHVACRQAPSPPLEEKVAGGSRHGPTSVGSPGGVQRGEGGSRVPFGRSWRRTSPCSRSSSSMTVPPIALPQLVRELALG